MGIRKRGVLLTVLLLTACSTPPPARLELEAVAVIGDSYTSGTRSGGEANKAWPFLAQAQLQQHGLDVEMSVGAEGGSGYVDPGGKGHVFADQVPVVVTPDDRLVVLYGSSNDAAHGTAISGLQQAVERTLAQVKSRAPKAKLLVIGPNYTHPNPPTGVLRVRDIMRLQVQTDGATWVDPIAERWFLDRPDLIAADSHPTDAGHAYLADKITPLIAAQLPNPAGPN